MSSEHWWGRRPPEGIALAWGARAIYRQGTGPAPDLPDLPERSWRAFRSRDGGPVIDLLPDRQSWRGPGPHPTVGASDERDALREWINTTGLPRLREACADLGPDEDRVVSFTEGERTIEASPNASYGYLYVVAYVLPCLRSPAQLAALEALEAHPNPPDCGSAAAYARLLTEQHRCPVCAPFGPAPGEVECPHCNGYGSSLKDPEGVDRCTRCGGSGTIAVAAVAEATAPRAGFVDPANIATGGSLRPEDNLPGGE